MRRAFTVLATAWLLYLLEPLSSTGLGFPLFFATFFGTVLVGAISLVLVLMRPTPLKAVGWLVHHPLAAASLLVLFLASQSPANPLFRLRFALSHAALAESARRAVAGTPPATPTWLGLFPVWLIDASPTEVRFLSDGCGVIDACGLLYSPGPLPAGRSKTKVQPIAGPWYHLYAVF